MNSTQKSLFDTHTHLNFDDPLFDLGVETSDNEDRVKSFIDNAHKAGVTHMLVPGTNLETSKKAIDIAHNDSNIYAAVGIHPADVLEEDGSKREEHIQALHNLAVSSEKVVAIGEAGLDSYWIFKKIGGDPSQKEARAAAQAVQKSYFTAQWHVAKTLQKAMIIHCRQAKKPLLKLLSEVWDDSFRNRVVFHCCEPDQDLLDFARGHDIFIGVDGDVTYDTAKQDFIRTVPLNRLVLETDAPFLMPEPVRQEKKFPNEPANVIHVAHMVANLHSCTFEEVQEATFSNSKTLFRV